MGGFCAAFTASHSRSSNITRCLGGEKRYMFCSDSSLIHTGKPAKLCTVIIIDLLSIAMVFSAVDHMMVSVHTKVRIHIHSEKETESKNVINLREMSFRVTPYMLSSHPSPQKLACPTVRVGGEAYPELWRIFLWISFPSYGANLRTYP
jgi:hypothetical protein